MGKALLWWLHWCPPPMPIPWHCLGIPDWPFHGQGPSYGHSMGVPPWPWHGPFHGHGSSIGGCNVPPFIPNGQCPGIALGFLVGHSMGKALLWGHHGCLPHGHGMGHSMGKALLWWLHWTPPQ